MLSAELLTVDVVLKLNFFSGGESHTNFTSLFDIDNLTNLFQTIFGDEEVVVFGEAYGGKQQKMSNTYGPKLKFVGFDVKVDKSWLEFVDIAAR